MSSRPASPATTTGRPARRRRSRCPWASQRRPSSRCPTARRCSCRWSAGRAIPMSRCPLTAARVTLLEPREAPGSSRGFALEGNRTLDVRQRGGKRRVVRRAGGLLGTTHRLGCGDSSAPRWRPNARAGVYGLVVLMGAPRPATAWAVVLRQAATACAIATWRGWSVRSTRPRGPARAARWSDGLGRRARQRSGRHRSDARW